jgi:hypothetical protein
MAHPVSLLVNTWLSQYLLGLLDYAKIMIILVNIEITIIQTIIFEFENMMYLFSMSAKKHFVTVIFKSKIMYRYVSSCSSLSIKHLMKKKLFKSRSKFG